MAVNSTTVSWEDLASTTLFNYRKKLEDNIFYACPFYWAMIASGRKITVDGGGSGGTDIITPIEYAKNETIESLQNDFDTVDTTPQDLATAAEDVLRLIAGSISISFADLARNQGRHQLINLLAARVNNLEMSFSEKLEIMTMAITAGNGGYDINPLAHFIRKDPTASTEVSGINQSTYSWWRNNYDSSSATGWVGLMREIDMLYLNCSKYGSKGKRSAPDFGLCDMRFYMTYMDASRGKIQLINETVANLSFGGVKHLNATLMWDEWVPDVEGQVAVTDPETYWSTYTKSTLYLLNTDFLKFCVMKGNDMKMGPFIQPENQLGKVSLLHLMAQITCSNRRKQGVLFNVIQSMTS